MLCEKDTPLSCGYKSNYCGFIVPDMFIVGDGFDFDEISAITAVQKQIQDKLKSALSIGIKVKIVEPMSIPRSEGKAKRVIDNRF